MAGSSSSYADDVIYDDVDDLYFSALHDHDEIFPISDEKYAYELQLQEALIVSSVSPIPHNISNSQPPSSSESKNKHPILITTSSSSLSISAAADSYYCGICTDTKKSSEMFHKYNVCKHVYCCDCIRSHVATKIRENHLNIVTCPHPDCTGVIGPEVCHSILPKQVLERWENILCENVIMGSDKFYCPFKDCSAMLVKDGDAAGVTSSECPNCHRLFCAECKVGWHSGINCSEYQSLNKGERNPEDLMLMDLANNQKWMRCPQCKFYVEKVSGCLHITCRCGYHFCYMCGKAYDGSHACAGAAV